MELKMIKPKDATHYSKSRNEYFHIDNACFIWDGKNWNEVFDIIFVGDLEEI